MYKILLVEDNAIVRSSYTDIMKQAGYNARAVTNSDDFFRELSDFEPDLVLLDMHLHNSRLQGVGILREMQERGIRDIPVIITTDVASRTEIAEAMKLGAINFIDKNSFNADKFLQDVKQTLDVRKLSHRTRNLALQNRLLREELHGKWEILGISPQINQAREKLELLAQSGLDVLVTGETGTGKELAAHYLHAHSSRCDNNIVKVNTGGLSGELVDSTLFGHKKGAFTGAVEDRKGYFEQADGGTIVLDEISCLNTDIQKKLLRVIENRMIPVLGSQDRMVDLRMIFISNRPLHELVSRGLFREDLFFRMEKATIELPPLREREGDITYLFSSFCERLHQETGKKADMDMDRAGSLLQKYHWPGNVRELKSFTEFLFALYPEIDLRIINKELSRKMGMAPAMTGDGLEKLFAIENLKQAGQEFERLYIKYQLNRRAGNVAQTARDLGVDRSTIYNKMEKE